ncbi:MAG: type II toxin-antitoxin system RelE/ParE family toxin [Bacteroidota bacterium]
MEVVILRSFLKDLRLKPKAVVLAAEELIAQLEASKNLELSGVDFKKMEGQKKGERYYRIRLGEWRVGIEYISPKIIVIRILARGEVYKHFPPH